jgi:hypothetical protein
MSRSRISGGRFQQTRSTPQASIRRTQRLRSATVRRRPRLTASSSKPGSPSVLLTGWRPSAKGSCKGEFLWQLHGQRSGFAEYRSGLRVRFDCAAHTGPPWRWKAHGRRGKPAVRCACSASRHHHLAKACSAWTAKKPSPLADLLQDRGWITPEERAHVEFVLERRLRTECGDVLAILMEAALPCAAVHAAEALVRMTTIINILIIIHLVMIHVKRPRSVETLGG